MEISPRAAILSAAVIPFRQGGGEGVEKRDAGKNREGEHIGVGVRKKMDVSLLFFLFYYCCRVFDYFRGLEMIPRFGYLGIGNSHGFDYRRHFFFFSIAKLILNSNFRYEAKSFSKNNREGREI